MSPRAWTTGTERDIRRELHRWRMHVRACTHVRARTRTHTHTHTHMCTHTRTHRWADRRRLSLRRLRPQRVTLPSPHTQLSSARLTTRPVNCTLLIVVTETCGPQFSAKCKVLHTGLPHACGKWPIWVFVWLPAYPQPFALMTFTPERAVTPA
jgi:hypothetical protein